MRRIIRGALAATAITGIGIAGLVIGTAGYLALMAALPFMLLAWPVAWLLHALTVARRSRRTTRALLLHHQAGRRNVANEVKAFARTRRG